MAFCKYCGSRVDDSSVFCSRCGKQLGGSAPQKSPVKFVIPAVLAAFIAVMLIFSSISNHSVSKKTSPASSTAVSIPNISIPPEPSSDAEYDKDEFSENTGANVVAVLNAITGRSDYIYGDFEPLIGITDLNENGCAEILAVYETKTGDISKVRCDVWRADATGAEELLSEVLFTEIGGNSGKLHLMRAFTENYDACYVMLERNETTGGRFKNSYAFYELSCDETALYYDCTFITEGRYDTEQGGIADADYYINTGKIPENPVSADNFNILLNQYNPIYALDIFSGEYDREHTLSFDLAWEAFGLAS